MNTQQVILPQLKFKEKLTLMAEGFAKSRCSRALIRAAFDVIKKNRIILLFPAISDIILIGIIAGLLDPLIRHYGSENALHHLSNQQLILFYVYVIVFMFFAHMIPIFFQTGLVYCITAYLRGESYSMRNSFKIMLKRAGIVYGYYSYCATFGFVYFLLQLVLKNWPYYRKLTSGLSWINAVFLSQPIINIHNFWPTTLIRTSGQLLVETYGYPLYRNFSVISYAMRLRFLALLPLIIGLIIYSRTAIIIGTAIAVILATIINSFQQTIITITSCACYQHAVFPEMKQPFDKQVLKNLFIQHEPD